MHLFQLFLVCLVTILCAFYIVYSSIGFLAALSVGAILLVLSFAALALVRRKYDRIGWHERKPIEMPRLPFKAQGWLDPLVFEADYIAWGWRDKIPYREITRVETRCVNDYFSGITVHTANQGKKSFDNWYSSGEPARTMLRVLRQQAPHAQFDGPSWIEQGWIPLLGFRHPNAPG